MYRGLISSLKLLSEIDKTFIRNENDSEKRWAMTSTRKERIVFLVYSHLHVAQRLLSLDVA